MPEPSNVEVVENCQVDWHKDTGILYVHNKATGWTIVRISQLPICPNHTMLANSSIDVLGARAIMPSGRNSMIVEMPPKEG